MKKEAQVKTHTRKTKGGKTSTVRAHSKKYEGAEDMVKKAMLAKEGAGKELAKRKKAVAKPEGEKLNAEDFKAWYHWDMQDDPKNEQAKKVEKCLKKKMGTKAYNKYLDDMSDNYTARGHTKAFKGLDLTEGKSTPANSKAPVAKSKQDSGTDKVASKGNKPFKVFGGVHTEAQMDKIEKDNAEWNTVGGIKKHIEELKKEGHAKKGHKEHPHYLWSVNKLKELQKSKTTTGGKTTAPTIPALKQHLTNVLNMDKAIKKGSKSKTAVTKGKASVAYLKKIGFLDKNGLTKTSWDVPSSTAKVFKQASESTKWWDD